MRTIKFNVYDTYLKQYVCKGISLLGEAMIFGRIEKYCEENPNPNYKHSLERFNDILFLQFTGLLDKNGEEIYEGDIVKITQHYYDCEDVDTYNAEVIFYENHSCFGYRSEDGWFSMLVGQGLEIEIIGNIHINPELI